MDPFRDYPKPVHSGQRCFPFRRCEVCSSPSAQLLQECFAMVRRSWSTAEIDILSKAAHSALLLPAASGVFTGMWLAVAVTGNRTGSPEPNARETGMTHSQTSAGRSARTTENTTEISLEVNGITRRLAVDPRTSLLDLLRERLGPTGTKKGCDHGQCGACTVLIDGRRANACLALAIAHDGTAVTTVEGLAAGDDLHPLQDAFIRHDAFQCGYCTPGQLCSAAGMLTEPGPSAITADLGTDPALTPGEIRERMSGNLCRCGAYGNIVRAITSAGQGA